MRRYGWLILGALLALLPSCGGAAPRDEAPLEYEAESPVELEAEQREHLETLETALARPEVDCDAVCTIEDRICELSERICAIAGRHPGDAETDGRCRDAAGRCEAARERVAGSCTCAP